MAVVIVLLMMVLPVIVLPLRALAIRAKPEADASQPRPDAKWVTAWGSSLQGLGQTGVTNATVRLIARVTIPGEAIRIRLANTFGTAPLVIGKAFVGERTSGAAIASGSNHQISFNGSASVTIPAGGTSVSDPVSMAIRSREDLAVSLYVPEADVRPTQHGLAFTTSYLTANGAGDVTADEKRQAFTASTTSMFWLKAIDVRSSSSTGAIVTFGDSITDGNCSTVDANNRWEDWMAVRLELDAARTRAPGAYKAVVNEGISGNTIGREHLQPPPDSPPGLERLDRDVFSHAGVTHVVVFMATNDIRRAASAAQVIAGTEELVKRIKDHGLKVIGATVIPRHNSTTANSPWDSAKTRIRNEVNEWMRTRASFDGLIDFDKVVRDPMNADVLYPAFNCDEIHPTPAGYYEMGKSIPLTLFAK